MEYLLNYMDNEKYSMIDKMLDSDMIFYLCNNKTNICNRINYLKEIGINNIGDIILNRFDLLTWELDDIKNYFDNNKNMIDLINNNDIDSLDLI